MWWLLRVAAILLCNAAFVAALHAVCTGKSHAWLKNAHVLLIIAGRLARSGETVLLMAAGACCSCDYCVQTVPVKHQVVNLCAAQGAGVAWACEPKLSIMHAHPMTSLTDDDDPVVEQAR